MKLSRVLAAALLLAACSSPPPAKEPVRDLRLAPAKAAQPEAVTAEDRSQEEGPLPVTADDAVRGSRNALVTIVLFTDLQCPYCARLAPTLDKVRETYGNDVRVVLKHNPLPFHAQARLAATVGQGVLATRGADAFWTYHDMVFRRQSDFVTSPEGVRRAAAAVGLSGAELEAGLRAGAWDAKVGRDMALADVVGAHGTPTIFVNGVVLVGAQPYEKIAPLVDAQLAEAKALVKSGTPAAQVYRVASVASYKPPSQREEEAEAEEPQEDKTVWKVPVAGAPVRGKPTALVTIVEFGDYACPFTKRVEPTLEELRKKYGDQIRIVWRDEPLAFHPRAMPAASLARFARAQKGEAGFWDVHDRLFASQPKLEAEDLESVATAAGLDAKKVAGALKDLAIKKGIYGDVDLAEDVEATGTPTFFVNGRKLVGAQKLARFSKLVDEEIANANAQLAKGVAPASLYDTLVKNGKVVELEKKTVAVPSRAPTRGPATAPVTIQVFSDFQCPFCQRSNPTIEHVLKAYPTKVKLVWRDLPLPFHQDAALAAEAAREAFAQKGNDGFWKMHARLFGDQRKLSRQDLEDHAQALGLDMPRFRAALDAHSHQAEIEADTKAAHDAGIQGTPGFLVGNVFVSGAQPFPRFRRAVDTALGLPRGQTAALDVPEPEPVKPAPSAPPSTPILGAASTPMPAGLVVQDVTVGTGRVVAPGDKVTVHYVGTFPDGREFDSSKKHGQPFTFTVGNGQVIKGWDTGLAGMKVGGRRKLTVPPDLAYGARGAGGVIPPNATLLFEIELLKIE